MRCSLKNLYTAVLICACLAPPLVSAAPGLALTAPVQVRATGAKNPTVAVDAQSGAVYLAWAQARPTQPSSAADSDASKKIPRLVAMLARSGDGGISFGAARVVSAEGDDVSSYSVSPTQVEVGPDGTVYVLYPIFEHSMPKGLADYPNLRHGLRLVRSSDGGKTFSAPTAIGTPEIEGVVTSLGMTSLFVAPDGKLYASWLDTRGTYAYVMKHGTFPSSHVYTSQLRVARSVDGGKTFAASTLAATSTCVCCSTRVAQGKTGPLYASTRSSWNELKGSIATVRDIFVATSYDHGKHWGKPVKVHDDRFKISACPDVNAGLAVDAKGHLHVAWYTGSARGPGVYYAVSNDRGKTFSRPIALLQDDWLPYGDVKLALDAAGNAWVAFEDRRGQHDLIRLARIGKDGSILYSKPWRGRNPDLAARPDGTVVVTWGGLPSGGDPHAGDIYTRIARVADTQRLAKTEIRP